MPEVGIAIAKDLILQPQDSLPELGSTGNINQEVDAGVDSEGEVTK